LQWFWLELLALPALIIFVIKRRTKHQVTDCVLEYETDAQEVDLGERSGHLDQEDEWDDNRFDNTVESAFNLPVQDLNDFSDHLFLPDANELF
jgi:hypothetical protein